MSELVKVEVDLKQVNLDALVTEFNNWQQKLFDAGREKVEALEKVQMVNRLVADSVERENTLKMDCHELRQSISNLQKCVLNRCNLEDENQALKGQIKDMEMAKEEICQKHEKALSARDEEIKELKSEHEIELADVEAAVKAQCALEKNAVQGSLDKKCEEIIQYHRKYEEQELKAQAELMRVRQEYELKILKLEKQATKKQAQTTSANLNQDIFRKKLQHAKIESDREIASLKDTISDLQQRLVAQQRTGGTSSSGLLPSKRTRRF